MSTETKPIKLTAVFAAIAVLVITGVALAAFSPVNSSGTSSTGTTSLSVAPSLSPSATTSAVRTSSSSTSGTGITILYVNGDPTSSVPANVKETLLSNFSTIAGKSPFQGKLGQTVLINVALNFQANPYYHQVTSVTVATPGFSLVLVSPATPISFTGFGGDQYMAGFNVTVLAPATPFSGNLTLLYSLA